MTDSILSSSGGTGSQRGVALVAASSLIPSPLPTLTLFLRLGSARQVLILGIVLCVCSRLLRRRLRRLALRLELPQHVLDKWLPHVGRVQHRLQDGVARRVARQRRVTRRLGRSEEGRADGGVRRRREERAHARQVACLGGDLQGPLPVRVDGARVCPRGEH